MCTLVNASGSIRLRLHGNLNFFGEETTLDLLSATISSPLLKPPSLSTTNVTASIDACNRDLGCELRLKRNHPHNHLPVSEFSSKVFYFGIFKMHLTGDSSVATLWIVAHSCGADTSATSISSALHFLVAIAKQFLCCYAHFLYPLATIRKKMISAPDLFVNPAAT